MVRSSEKATLFAFVLGRLPGWCYISSRRCVWNNAIFCEENTSAPFLFELFAFVCPLFENCFAGFGLVASILQFSKWVTITFKSRFLSTHCSPPTGSLHQRFPIISRPLATVTTHCPIAPTCPQSYQQQKIRFLGRAIQNLVHHSFLHCIFHSNIPYIDMPCY